MGVIFRVRSRGQWRLGVDNWQLVELVCAAFALAWAATAQGAGDPPVPAPLRPAVPPGPAKGPGGAGVTGNPIALKPGPKNEILNRATQEIRNNLGKLKTWRGTLTVTDVVHEQGKKIAAVKYEVAFCVDTTADCVRWNRTTVEHFNASTGTTAPADLLYESGMRKKDAFYRYGPKKMGSNVWATATTGPTSRIQYGPTSTDFDPMYYFTDHGGSLADQFVFYYEHSGDPGWHWKTTVTGDRVTVEAAVSVAINRTVVDLAKGATVAESYQLTRDAAGKVAVQESALIGEYREINGVWVPSTIKYFNDNKRANTRIDRTIVWNDQVVNGPLPADAFTVAAMNARPGDEVVDSRSGVRVTVPGASPRGADPVEPASDTSPAARPRYLWLAAVNGCVLVALVGWWVWRRWLRPEQHADRT